MVKYDSAFRLKADPKSVSPFNNMLDKITSLLNGTSSLYEGETITAEKWISFGADIKSVIEEYLKVS